MAPIHRLCCLVALLLWIVPTRSVAQLADADRSWAARAEILEGRLAKAERIEETITYYRAAAMPRGASLEARWKFLRALHYLIDFSDAPEMRKDAAMEEAINLVRRTPLTRQAAEIDTYHNARLAFWSAITWGGRAKRVGLLTVVREGAALEMHDLAERALTLDSGVDQGGALRLLSRLHAELPRIPFVSGWVDREKVLPFAEQAFAIDPEHPGNHLILALALLDRAPTRRRDAIALLEGVARREVQRKFLVEELAIREQARKRLVALNEESR